MQVLNKVVMKVFGIFKIEEYSFKNENDEVMNNRDKLIKMYSVMR